MKKAVIIIFLFLGSTLAGIAQTKKFAAPASKTKKTTPKHVTTYQTVAPPTNQKEQRVELTTEYGVMILKLYNQTPKHRDNFIKLIKEGFYDSLLFHRVINTFMIQGGDPLSKHSDTSQTLGGGDVGYKIPAEFNTTLFHKKGALAAARDNNPEKASSGCQFYIVQGKKYTLKEMEQMINSRNMSRKQQILYELYQRDTVQSTLSAFQNSGDKEAIRKYVETLQPAADKEYNTKYPDATVVNMDQIDVYQQMGGTPQLDGDYTVFGEVEKGMEVIDKIAKLPTRPTDNRPLQNVRMKMRLL